VSLVLQHLDPPLAQEGPHGAPRFVGRGIERSAELQGVLDDLAAQLGKWFAGHRDYPQRGSLRSERGYTSSHLRHVARHGSQSHEVLQLAIDLAQAEEMETLGGGGVLPRKKDSQ
jgi:hypothetical protein